MNNITYRSMEKHEEKKIRRLAMHCFQWFYSLILLFDSFKNAIIAVSDGNPVGGAVWRNIKIGEKTVGYLEYGFTHKDWQGKGIGKETYTRAIQASRDAGAECVSSLVLGDNTSSWKLFQRQGFVRTGLLGLIKLFGFWGGLKLALNTAFLFSPGAWFWVSDQKEIPKQHPATAFIGYVLLTALWGYLLTIRHGVNSIDSLFFAGFLSTLILFRVACSAVSALFFNKKFHFQLSTGGILTQLLMAVAAGVFFPPQGNFYPKEKEWDARKLKKQLGILGLITWISTPLFFAVIIFLPPIRSLPEAFFEPAVAALYVILTLDSAFFLMEEMAGHRVWQWNKAVYCVSLSLIIGSVVLLELFGF